MYEELLENKEIRYDKAQENFVNHLSITQKNIEEYEEIWLKYKDSLNIRNQFEKNSQKSTPKYKQTKPKRTTFRSFLIENITPEVQTNEQKEGSNIFNNFQISNRHSMHHKN